MHRATHIDVAGKRVLLKSACLCDAGSSPAGATIVRIVRLAQRGERNVDSVEREVRLLQWTPAFVLHCL